ncbi:MAG: hypothetical protein CVV42_14745 [Candidatus Riflebacteria bacterium HGW-Riflebacteria-2]|jgi:WD40 repeat protein|nr:MAG: hypothetical protein CVV42_14745 [Candidatus Riflebacteria bacterium HGW-Riflebacteria-2]
MNIHDCLIGRKTTCLVILAVLFSFYSLPGFAEGISAKLRYEKRMSEAVVLEATISPDSKTLITLNGDFSVGLWDLQTGQLLKSLTGHKGRLMRVAVSADGKYLATGAWDKDKVKIWNMATGELIREMANFDDLASLALSNDGQLLAASGIPSGQTKDCTVELWDVAKGTRLAVLAKKPVDHFYPGSLRFSPDGKHLAAGVQNRSHGILIWDVATQKLLKNIPHANDVIAIDYSPDGKKIAGGGMGNTACVWDAQTGKLLLQMKGHTDHITGASFHPGGRYFATTSFGSKSLFRIWDLQTGTEAYAHAGRARTHNLTFSRDGKSLAVVITTYGNLGDPATLEVYDINQ